MSPATNLISIVTAGAGSGKTTRVATDVAREIMGGTNPARIIVTTFTRKAASELSARIRAELISNGAVDETRKLQRALIGTVNSVCGSLVARFAFELGMPPAIAILDEADGAVMMHRALEAAVTSALAERLNDLDVRFSRDVRRPGSNQDHGWRSEVSRIIGCARSNRLDAAALAASADESVAELLAALPAATLSQAELLKRIDAEIGRTLAAVPPEDATRVTGEAKAKIASVRRRIRTAPQAVSWGEIGGLASVKPGAKSRDAFELLQAAGAQFECCAEFGEDVVAYVRGCFDAAAATLGEYDEQKRVAGVMDFVDQEAKLLDALDRASVRSEIAASFSLLVVDEFQDTSPIQLALFTKLAQAGLRVIWVGDPKQSIYGFRDADPSLMLATVDTLPASARDSLPLSYRSRPDLVHFHNALFTPAFGRTMPGLPVALGPHRAPDPGAATAVQLWRFPYVRERSTNAAFHDDLAGWLARELGAGAFASDSPVTPGDVAILCRANATCAALAPALENAGVPALTERPGLMRSPEAVLICAALRYAADRHDSLAVAEIRLLSEGHADAGSIIADRIADPDGWAQDNEIVAAIGAARAELRSLSGVAAMDSLLARLSLHRLLHRFGDPQQSSASVDAIRALAAERMDRAAHRGEATDLAAVVRELDAIAAAETDTMPIPAGKDAVSVLTYHGAKGLEWPVVIALDLGSTGRDATFALEMTSPGGTLDISNPLKDRRVRFWPNPGVPKESGFATALAGHPATAAREESESAERQRLLYVGLTRAKDFLILPVRQRAGGAPRWDWLAETAAASGTVIELPEADGVTDGFLPQVTGPFPVEVRTLPADACERVSRGPRTVQLIVPARGVTVYEAYLVTPSGEEETGRVAAGEPAGDLSLVEHVYGEPLSVTAVPNWADLGTAVHAVLARSVGRGAAVDAQEISRTLERYGVADAFPAEGLRSQVEGFVRWTADQMPGAKLEVEPSARMLVDGRLVNARLDLVLEGEYEIWIVDHKTLRLADDVRSVAAHYGEQLEWYRRVLGCQRAGGKRIRTWLNLLVQGRVVEVGSTTAPPPGSPPCTRAHP